jgi:hypothetical protein
VAAGCPERAIGALGEALALVEGTANQQGLAFARLAQGLDRAGQG